MIFSRYSILFSLTLFLGVQASTAVSSPVTLTGKTISGTRVKVTCSLSSGISSKSKKIQIGRAFNSNSYSVIASTTRKVKRLGARTRLANAGRYYFICRVTLRSGKVVSSNRLTATVANPAPTPTTEPTISPGLQSCPGGYVGEVVNLVNQARADNGGSALQSNSKLSSAAQGHTNWMATNQNLTHGTVEEMAQRIRDTGYIGSPVGENIAYGQTSPSEVMNAWMNSAGHRGNILNSRYHNIGVGCVIDPYGRYWWTQDFGG